MWACSSIRDRDGVQIERMQPGSKPEIRVMTRNRIEHLKESFERRQVRLEGKLHRIQSLRCVYLQKDRLHVGRNPEVRDFEIRDVFIQVGFCFCPPAPDQLRFAIKDKRLDVSPLWQPDRKPTRANAVFIQRFGYLSQPTPDTLGILQPPDAKPQVSPILIEERLVLLIIRDPTRDGLFGVGISQVVQKPRCHLAAHASSICCLAQRFASSPNNKRKESNRSSKPRTMAMRGS